ncbi:MAG: CoA pyrophosphatase [Treponema sp.]|nr:CoA pyrophosphatase [Treponema sp.]
MLILLYPEAGELRFPLIQRSSGLNHHANQIGLPGGALEAGERAIEAALRESREELGIDTETVEILRELSPLGLSVSAYTVYPVVGYTGKVPVFCPNTAEVARCFTVPLAELLRPEAIINLTIEDGRQVPAYRLAGEAVWGATAMILSELADLLT